MLRKRHPLAGKTVTLHPKSKPFNGVENGAQFVIEDWWENVGGGSWMDAQGNPACLCYAMRSGMGCLPGKPIPTDNEVVYGKIGPFGHLVHVSELGPIATTQQGGE